MTATGEDRHEHEALREQAAAWLGRLRGVSTAEDHAAFEQWYAADPRHAAAYDAVLESWEMAGLAQARPTRQAHLDLAPIAARRSRYAITAIAATVVIVLLAFGAYGAGVIGPRPVRPVEFAGRAGEIRVIELADGSRVTLDTGSRIRAAYSADERRILLLKGRARFQVAHNSARPFVVATRAGLVVAHGTVFDVAVAGERVTVSLLEGSVEVRPAPATPGARSGSSRMLTPGQRIEMSAGKALPPPTSTNQSEADWPYAMLSFENAPLDALIAVANRNGASRIVLADPSLGKLRVTGTFRVAETDSLAMMLAAMFDLRLSHADAGTLVLARSQTP
jgi:transmembrane sensor